MIVTCGTDIIEIDRIKDSVNGNNGRFIDEVYNEKEIEYCDSKNVMKYQHYAARFAAKEAIFKAISNKIDNKFDLTWKDVEIINDQKRKTICQFFTKKTKKFREYRY